MAMKTCCDGWPVIFAALVAVGPVPATAEAPPNVVLMMADDLGWGDPQCFNADSPIETPHLDAMAAAGLRFSRFYAAAPVCSPTRGSCLTGRHPYRYGIHGANHGSMPDGELTLAELLRENGYATGHFGKWHLGTLTTKVHDSNRGGPGSDDVYAPPSAHGFDVCFSTEAKVPTWDPMLKPSESASRLGWDFIQDPASAVRYGTRYWNEAGDIVAENLRGDDSRVIMDRAVEFIEQTAAGNQPFLAVVWFHAPHLPVVAGPQEAARYAERDKLTKNYYGCITAMDRQIGRLRATLRSAGVAENTMVWFCSDNGPEGAAASAPGSAGRLRGRKRSLYEGGVRVPGIVEWPGRVAAGSTTDFPAVTSDYAPTVLEAAQINMPDDRSIDGVSLMGVLAGEVSVRDAPIGFRSAKQRSLITQQVKLYSGDNGQTWELYDLHADPSETTDLAASRREQVAELVEVWEQWRASCDQSSRGGDY